MARRRPVSEESVELTLTSMLDVIFNILAFFVATYSPPAPERNFDVSLPSAKVGAGPADLNRLPELPTDIDLNPFQDVTITLSANPQGGLGGINLESKPIQGGFIALSRELRATASAVSKGSGPKLEAATIVAAPGLKYRHLVAAIDACYQAGIQKINFGEAR